MKVIVNKRIFKQNSQRGIFNNYYESVVIISIIHMIASILVFYNDVNHICIFHPVVQLTYIIFLFFCISLSKRLSPWVKEIILIVITLYISVTLIHLNFEPDIRNESTTFYIIYDLILVTNFLIISLGGVIKMYKYSLEIRQINPVSELGNIRWISLFIDERVKADIDYGVLFIIRMEKYRIINSIYGKEIGEKIIKIAAGYLKTVINENTKVAHINDMEFCLWIENKDIGFIKTEIERIKTEIISEVSIVEKSINLEFLSSGAVYPDDGRDFYQLFGKANMVMEKIMVSDCRTSHLFSPGIESDFKMDQIYGCEIEKAIRQKTFKLLYQKKYDLDGIVIHGFEALTRCYSPLIGDIPPYVFIPIIHKMGYTIEFTKQIIDKVLLDINTIDDIYGEGLQMSINIPSVFIHDKDAISFVRSRISQEGVRPERITFEITEDFSIGGEREFKLLEEIQKTGIKISLDDFGTGYSSLSYLLKIPIQELKIDKCFIENIHKSYRNFILVKAICDIAKSHNCSVVAEGVESIDQVLSLKNTNCDLIQGFIYSRPESVLSLCKEKTLQHGTCDKLYASV